MILKQVLFETAHRIFFQPSLSGLTSFKVNTSKAFTQASTFLKQVLIPLSLLYSESESAQLVKTLSHYLAESYTQASSYLLARSVEAIRSFSEASTFTVNKHINAIKAFTESGRK